MSSKTSSAVLRFGSYVLAGVVAVAISRLWNPGEKPGRPAATSTGALVEPPQARPAPRPEARPPSKPRPVRIEQPPDREDEDAPAPSNSAKSVLARERETDAKAEREEHAQQVIAHRQEPRDIRWAQEMEATLGTTLNFASELIGASVKSIDCRTTSCAVDLRWPSEADARAHLSATVEAIGVGVPCARRLTLPETQTPGGELNATLLLDCAEARWPADGPAARER